MFPKYKKLINVEIRIVKTVHVLDPLLLNSAHVIEKLEKVQLSAARIVTGLAVFVSRESLCTKTGWQT